MTIGEPTYYTRHPDDTYSVADPRPSVQQVDLTDDEIHELVLTWENHALVRAVIAAYKEKNK